MRKILFSVLSFDFVHIHSEAKTVRFIMADNHGAGNYFVDILIIFFGISAWIGITGIYLQLPQIVDTAPEAWKLPSYIVIIVQCGNIASLAYVIYDRYSSIRFDDSNLIYFTLFIGCLAAILMAFLYQNTTIINGEPKSIALMTFAFMFAMVGCLSSVLFMPFMGRFRECYLITYMFGQGLNGFISSIVSLIQGVGTMECKNDTLPANATNADTSEPLFGPEAYFLFVFVVMLMSSISFLLLNKLDVCKKEWINTDNRSINSAHDYENIATNVDESTSFNFYYLMILIGVISFSNYGILPGIQSYSCLPYGASAYHLSTTFSSIANPLACLIAMYFTTSSIHWITVQFLISVALTIMILFTALESPTPPLASEISGRIIIVSLFISNKINALRKSVFFPVGYHLDIVLGNCDIYEIVNFTKNSMP